jgi:opacity protein-like surface antigen
MSSKRTYRVLGLMFLALTLVLLPGPAKSAMWVGGELGGNFISSSNLSVNGVTVSRDAKFQPSVIGGVTLGYDFVNTGFAGYNWPTWMQYFSFAVDFTYNRMDVHLGNLGVNNVGASRFEGYMAAVTFLFMGHYGFFPDTDVPSGRVNPYIGVGPAILMSGLDLGSVGEGNRGATDVALVVEAGVRWVCLKNVSIDTAYRFRWAQPSYGLDGATLKVANVYSNSFLVRANYHF